jgi:hypothetical protein
LHQTDKYFAAGEIGEETLVRVAMSLNRAANEEFNLKVNKYLRCCPDHGPGGELYQRNGRLHPFQMYPPNRCVHAKRNIDKQNRVS